MTLKDSISVLAVVNWMTLLLGAKHVRIIRIKGQALAKKLGVGRKLVAIKRCELGIENFVSRTTNERWTPQIRKKLGKVADSEIAAELGIPVATVIGYRSRNQIPGLVNRRRQRIHWSPEMIKRLGKVQDSELARELGVRR